MLHSVRCFSLKKSLPVPPQVADYLRRAQAYCFDVDSTVITKEGIDELAAYKNVGKEVADLTAK
jgi:phosphoserine phosphatase